MKHKEKNLDSPIEIELDRVSSENDQRHTRSVKQMMNQ
jgi:hypothetical protein